MAGAEAIFNGLKDFAFAYPMVAALVAITILGAVVGVARAIWSCCFLVHTKKQEQLSPQQIKELLQKTGDWQTKGAAKAESIRFEGRAIQQVAQAFKDANKFSRKGRYYDYKSNQIVEEEWPEFLANKILNRDGWIYSGDEERELARRVHSFSNKELSKEAQPILFKFRELSEPTIGALLKEICSSWSSFDHHLWNPYMLEITALRAYQRNPDKYRSLYQESILRKVVIREILYRWGLPIDPHYITDKEQCLQGRESPEHAQESVREIAGILQQAASREVGACAAAQGKQAKLPQLEVAVGFAKKENAAGFVLTQFTVVKPLASDSAYDGALIEDFRRAFTAWLATEEHAPPVGVGACITIGGFKVEFGQPEEQSGTWLIKVWVGAEAEGMQSWDRDTAMQLMQFSLKDRIKELLAAGINSQATLTITHIGKAERAMEPFFGPVLDQIGKIFAHPGVTTINLYCDTYGSAYTEAISYHSQAGSIPEAAGEKIRQGGNVFIAAGSVVGACHATTVKEILTIKIREKVIIFIPLPTTGQTTSHDKSYSNILYPYGIRWEVYDFTKPAFITGQSLELPNIIIVWTNTVEEALEWLDFIKQEAASKGAPYTATRPCPEAGVVTAERETSPPVAGGVSSLPCFGVGLSAAAGAAVAAPLNRTKHSSITYDVAKDRGKTYISEGGREVDLSCEIPVVKGLAPELSEQLRKRFLPLSGNACRAPPLDIEFTTELQSDPAHPERKFLIEYTFDGTKGHIKAHPILLESDQDLAGFLGIYQIHLANLFAQTRLYHEIHDHHILGNRTAEDADKLADRETLSWLLVNLQNLEAEVEVLRQYGRNGIYPVGCWLRDVEQSLNKDILAKILARYFLENKISLDGNGLQRAEDITSETGYLLQEYLEKAVSYFLFGAPGFLVPGRLDNINIITIAGFPGAARLRRRISAGLDYDIRQMAIKITEQAKDNPESGLRKKIDAEAKRGDLLLSLAGRGMGRRISADEINRLVNDVLWLAFAGIGTRFITHDDFLQLISANLNCMDLALNQLTKITVEDIQRFFFGQRTQYFAVLMHRNIRQAVQRICGPLFNPLFKIKVVHLDIVNDEQGEPQEIIIVFAGMGRVITNNLPLVFKRQKANRWHAALEQREFAPLQFKYPTLETIDLIPEDAWAGGAKATPSGSVVAGSPLQEAEAADSRAGDINVVLRNLMERMQSGDLMKYCFSCREFGGESGSVLVESLLDKKAKEFFSAFPQANRQMSEEEKLAFRKTLYILCRAAASAHYGFINLDCPLVYPDELVHLIQKLLGCECRELTSVSVPPSSHNWWSSYKNHSALILSIAGCQLFVDFTFPFTADHAEGMNRGPKLIILPSEMLINDADLMVLYPVDPAVVSGRGRRLLVLDLDNTLWEGVLDEVGLQGVKLNKAQLILQLWAYGLYKQGVKLSVISKNVEAGITRQAIEQTLGMVLKLENFDYLRINLRDKARNLARILEAYNSADPQTGYDFSDVVFIDDGPFERNNMVQAYPDVLAPALPADTGKLKEFLGRITPLFIVNVTGDGAQEWRDDLRQQIRTRAALRKRVSSLRQFVKESAIKLFPGINEFSLASRIAQITEHTHQFNLTNKEYECGQILDLAVEAAKREARVYTFAMRDKYADYRNIGLVIIKKVAGVWHIDAFCVSCRALNKGIHPELAMLHFVLTDLQKQLSYTGISMVRAGYTRTPRNKRREGFYARQGFRRIYSQEESSIWEFDLRSGKICRLPSWITCLAPAQAESQQPPLPEIPRCLPGDSTSQPAKPQLANSYKIIGWALGVIIGTQLLGLPLVAAGIISFAAFLFGWLIHEMGHKLGKYYNPSCEIRAGPLASLALFAASLLFTYILAAGGFALNSLPISICLIAAANYLAHIFSHEFILIKAAVRLLRLLTQGQHPKIMIMLLGPPGAGKGTVAKIFLKTLKYSLHISTGDIIGGNIARGTELGLRAKENKEKGLLVDDSLVIPMALNRLNQPDARGKIVILDGFPRNLRQAEALDVELGKKETVEKLLVFCITLPDEELIRRLLGRLTCPKCSTTFHIDNRKPKQEGICDACGAKLIRRSDDKPDAIAQRLEVSRKETIPLLGYYRLSGRVLVLSAQKVSECVVINALLKIPAPKYSVLKNVVFGFSEETQRDSRIAFLRHYLICKGYNVIQLELLAGNPSKGNLFISDNLEAVNKALHNGVMAVWLDRTDLEEGIIAVSKVLILAKKFLRLIGNCLSQKLIKDLRFQLVAVLLLALGGYVLPLLGVKVGLVAAGAGKLILAGCGLGCVVGGAPVAKPKEIVAVPSSRRISPRSFIWAKTKTLSNARPLWNLLKEFWFTFRACTPQCRSKLLYLPWLVGSNSRFERSGVSARRRGWWGSKFAAAAALISVGLISCGLPRFRPEILVLILRSLLRGGSFPPFAVGLGVLGLGNLAMQAAGINPVMATQVLSADIGGWGLGISILFGIIAGLWVLLKCGNKHLDYEAIRQKYSFILKLTIAVLGFTALIFSIMPLWPLIAGWLSSAVDWLLEILGCSVAITGSLAMAQLGVCSISGAGEGKPAPDSQWQGIAAAEQKDRESAAGEAVRNVHENAQVQRVLLVAPALTLDEAYKFLKSNQVFQDEDDFEHSKRLAEAVAKYSKIKKVLVAGSGLIEFPLLLALMGKEAVFVDMNMNNLRAFQLTVLNIQQRLGVKTNKPLIQCICSEIGELDLKGYGLEPNSFDLISLVDLASLPLQGEPRQWLLKTKELLDPNEGYIIIDEDNRTENAMIRYFADIFPNRGLLEGGTYFSGTYNALPINRFYIVETTGAKGNVLETTQPQPPAMAAQSAAPSSANSSYRDNTEAGKNTFEISIHNGHLPEKDKGSFESYEKEARKFDLWQQFKEAISERKGRLQGSPQKGEYIDISIGGLDQALLDIIVGKLLVSVSGFDEAVDRYYVSFHADSALKTLAESLVHIDFMKGEIEKAVVSVNLSSTSLTKQILAIFHELAEVEALEVIIKRYPLLISNDLLRLQETGYTDWLAYDRDAKYATSMGLILEHQEFNQELRGRTLARLKNNEAELKKIFMKLGGWPEELEGVFDLSQAIVSSKKSFGFEACEVEELTDMLETGKWSDFRARCLSFAEAVARETSQRLTKIRIIMLAKEAKAEVEIFGERQVNGLAPRGDGGSLSDFRKLKAIKLPARLLSGQGVCARIPALINAGFVSIDLTDPSGYYLQFFINKILAQVKALDLLNVAFAAKENYEVEAKEEFEGEITTLSLKPAASVPGGAVQIYSPTITLKSRSGKFKAIGAFRGGWIVPDIEGIPEHSSLPMELYLSLDSTGLIHPEKRLTVKDIPEILSGVKDRNPQLRYVLMMALVIINHVRCGEAIIGAMEDPDPRIRRKAAGYLYEHPDPRFAPFLMGEILATLEPTEENEMWRGFHLIVTLDQIDAITPISSEWLAILDAVRDVTSPRKGKIIEAINLTRDSIDWPDRIKSAIDEALPHTGIHVTISEFLDIVRKRKITYNAAGKKELEAAPQSSAARTAMIQPFPESHGVLDNLREGDGGNVKQIMRTMIDDRAKKETPEVSLAGKALQLIEQEEGRKTRPQLLIPELEDLVKSFRICADSIELNLPRGNWQINIGLLKSYGNLKAIEASLMAKFKDKDMVKAWMKGLERADAFRKTADLAQRALMRMKPYTGNMTTLIEELSRQEEGEVIHLGAQEEPVSESIISTSAAAKPVPDAQAAVAEEIGDGSGFSTKEIRLSSIAIDLSLLGFSGLAAQTEINPSMATKILSADIGVNGLVISILLGVIVGFWVLRTYGNNHSYNEESRQKYPIGLKLAIAVFGITVFLVSIMPLWPLIEGWLFDAVDWVLEILGCSVAIAGSLAQGGTGRLSRGEIMRQIREAYAKEAGTVGSVNEPEHSLAESLAAADTLTDALLKTAVKSGRIKDPPAVRYVKIMGTECTFGAYLVYGETGILDGTLYIQRPWLKKETPAQIILHEKIEQEVKNHTTANSLSEELLAIRALVGVKVARENAQQILPLRIWRLYSYLRKLFCNTFSARQLAQASAKSSGTEASDLTKAWVGAKLDYRPLAMLFPANDFLQYTWPMHLVTMPLMSMNRERKEKVILPPEIEGLYQELDTRIRDMYLEDLKQGLLQRELWNPVHPYYRWDSAETAERYREVSQLALRFEQGLREYYAPFLSSQGGVSAEETDEIRLYLINARKVAEGILLLLNENQGSADIHTLLEAMLYLVFSTYHVSRYKSAIAIKKAFFNQPLLVPAQINKLAYLILGVLIHLRGPSSLDRKDDPLSLRVATETSSKENRSWAVITLESSAAIPDANYKVTVGRGLEDVDTGLGVALSRAIAGELGGSVEVTEGKKIVIKLPCHSTLRQAKVGSWQENCFLGLLGRKNNTAVGGVFGRLTDAGLDIAGSEVTDSGTIPVLRGEEILFSEGFLDTLYLDFFDILEVFSVAGNQNGLIFAGRSGNKRVSHTGIIGSLKTRGNSYDGRSDIQNREEPQERRNFFFLSRSESGSGQEFVFANCRNAGFASPRFDFSEEGSNRGIPTEMVNNDISVKQVPQNLSSPPDETGFPLFANFVFERNAARKFIAENTGAFLQGRAHLRFSGFLAPKMSGNQPFDVFNFVFKRIQRFQELI
ncbi:MAG: nucleoside monophosphate kinase, partial [Candidatus Omnitrophota bacterium]